jgi:hypothetical protein
VEEEVKSYSALAEGCSDKHWDFDTAEIVKINYDLYLIPHRKMKL